MDNNYSVYVLWSERLKCRYVGTASDIYLRLTQHNQGMTPYTSKGTPWILRYAEQYVTLSLARRRESFLKSGAGREFLNRALSGKDGYPECELSSDCIKYEFFTER
ncbi:MAG: GIY-YIG nuclease family protein [Kiritimatiellia bacterium]|nr:GIY-YIG nuclease family protein [Kiritimatiellia bacterium]